MAFVEPRYATDYDSRTVAAVKSVLVEIGQILASSRGSVVVIGGADPWLLLSNPDVPHVGTTDIDLSLDAAALAKGQYAALIQSLQRQGHHQQANLRRFQLVRTVSMCDGGRDIDVLVDFLMPRNARVHKNVPPIIPNFAVQRADGADLAHKFSQVIVIEGDMPDGGCNRVRIAVASIPAILAMKGYAIENRMKRKDAYDIYYCILNFVDGTDGAKSPCTQFGVPWGRQNSAKTYDAVSMDALVAATLPLLKEKTARKGYVAISRKFRHVDDFGPTCVRQFLENSEFFGERTADRWQQDASGQVNT